MRGGGRPHAQKVGVVRAGRHPRALQEEGAGWLLVPGDQSWPRCRWLIQGLGGMLAVASRWPLLLHAAPLDQRQAHQQQLLWPASPRPHPRPQVLGHGLARGGRVQAHSGQQQSLVC